MNKFYLGIIAMGALLAHESAYALGVKVVNTSPKALVGGYSVELEIRNVNDPVFSHEFDFKDLGAKKMQLFSTSPTDDLKIPETIAASNFIVRLKKNGKIISQAQNTQGAINKNQFAGIEISCERTLMNPPKVSFVLTSDASVTLPLTDLPKGTHME